MDIFGINTSLNKPKCDAYSFRCYNLYFSEDFIVMTEKKMLIKVARGCVLVHCLILFEKKSNYDQTPAAVTLFYLSDNKLQHVY